MRRLSRNRDLFEASPGEKIIVTVEAVKTPFQVTFSDLKSGGRWTVLQQPTPSQPAEKRQFVMPNANREFFTILYAFPPGLRDFAGGYVMADDTPWTFTEKASVVITIATGVLLPAGLALKGVTEAAGGTAVT